MEVICYQPFLVAGLGDAQVVYLNLHSCLTRQQVILSSHSSAFEAKAQELSTVNLLPGAHQDVGLESRNHGDRINTLNLSPPPFRSGTVTGSIDRVG